MKYLCLLLLGLTVLCTLGNGCERGNLIEEARHVNEMSVQSQSLGFFIAQIELDGTISELWSEDLILSTFKPITGASILSYTIAWVDDAYYLIGETDRMTIYRKLVLSDNAQRMIPTGDVVTCIATDCTRCKLKSNFCKCIDDSTTNGCIKEIGDYGLTD